MGESLDVSDTAELAVIIPVVSQDYTAKEKTLTVLALK
jgi:hypothetical protein